MRMNISLKTVLESLSDEDVIKLAIAKVLEGTKDMDSCLSEAEDYLGEGWDFYDVLLDSLYKVHDSITDEDECDEDECDNDYEEDTDWDEDEEDWDEDDETARLIEENRRKNEEILGIEL